MRLLTLDDLLPLHEFADRRREFFESLTRYLDRYRRICIGPQLTLVFENRQTLWFRVQDILRITRLADPARIQEELDLYNRLLPGRDTLHAALINAVSDEARLSQELAIWQKLIGKAIHLRVDKQCWPASLVTCRPEDLAIGAAHWLSFTISPEARRALADFSLPARFEVNFADYQHASPLLSEEVRQSLLDDLDLSDRDE
jgi:hypothetical protein